MAIPLLDDLDLCGKDLTADALLTQRKLADYLVRTRKAHYHFTVKANQPSLLDDLVLFFNDRHQPQFVMHDPPDHGRIETRQIWTTTELNAYLNFPHLGQAFAIERITLNKKTGKTSREIAYGITSRSPGQASPQRLLEINRGHWTIENCCHYVLDWAFDEDRCRIRTGYGPENISRVCDQLLFLELTLNRPLRPDAKFVGVFENLHRHLVITLERLLGVGPERFHLCACGMLRRSNRRP